MNLEARLADVERRFGDIEHEMATLDVAADPSRMRELGREYSQLQHVVDNWRKLRGVREQLAAARRERELEHESDPEMHALTQQVIGELEAEEAALVDALRLQLLPRDPNDERNVIMEISAGVGGEEAALFAAELLRMYLRYAERHRFKTEVMSASETGIGGINKAIVEI